MTSFRFFIPSTATVGVLLTAVVACPLEAEAAGFGLTAKFAHTTGTITEVDTDEELDLTSNGAQLGGVLDTNVTGDGIFNYRLTLAFEYGSVTWFDDFDLTSLGGSVTNTFGFGIIRDFDFRLYLGPSIRLAVSSITSDLQTSATQVDAGVGAEIGFNWHLTSWMSLSTTVSYHAQVTSTDSEIDSVEGQVLDFSFLGLTHHVTAGVTVLFLTGADAI